MLVILMLDLLGGLLVFTFLLFVPGHFLGLGFFPRKGDLSRLERLVYAIVFSLTFLPLALLAGGQFLRMPVNAETVLGLALFLVLMGLLAYLFRIGKLLPKAAPKALEKLLPKIRPNEAASILPWQ